MMNCSFPTPLWLAKEYEPRVTKCPTHLRLLDDKLRQLYDGKFTRLIVTMPPRHGKSNLISRFFPSWLLLMNPKLKIFLTSYETTYAQSYGKKVSDIYKDYGGKFNIDRNGYSETIEGGSISSVGMDGAITGKGADFLIIDDPIKNDSQAFSKTYRNRIWNWFVSTAYSRLEPEGKIVVIMTRWHYDDLVGRLLNEMEEQGEHWEVVNMPAINERNEALWQERYPIDALEKIRLVQGSYWFSALYQQMPIASEYQIFKEEYWRFYSNLNKSDIIFTVQAWDTAFKQGENNDYSVCCTMAVTDNGFYILGLFKGKPSFDGLKKQVVSEYLMFLPNKVLIEDAASGQSLIQETRREQTKIPVKPMPTESKEIRAHRVSSQFENNNVYLREGAEYNRDIVSEMAVFPAGSHDDIVDTICLCIDYLTPYHKRRKGQGFGVAQSDSSFIRNLY